MSQCDPSFEKSWLRPWIYLSCTVAQLGDLDSQSSGPGFEFCPIHNLNLLHGSREFKSSATLVHSQSVCLLPVGILNNVMFNLNYRIVSVVCSAPLTLML